MTLRQIGYQISQSLDGISNAWDGFWNGLLDSEAVVIALQYTFIGLAWAFGLFPIFLLLRALMRACRAGAARALATRRQRIRAVWWALLLCLLVGGVALLPSDIRSYALRGLFLVLILVFCGVAVFLASCDVVRACRGRFARRQRAQAEG